MTRSVRRAGKAAAVACVGLVVGGLLVTTQVASAAVSAGPVINEVYGGGGNSGATLTNDFVELATRSGATGLDGYSVQYLPGSPSASSTWQVTPLTGSAVNGLYLVQEAKGSGGTTALPTPQATGSIQLAAGSGTVALVHGTTALTCLTAAACTADPTVTDLVGYGTAVVHEGAADAPVASATQSVQRTAAPDTDDNAVDFQAATPTPGAANAGAPTGPTCTPADAGTTQIHDIQGTGFTSPLAGQKVTNVRGVVTGVRSGSGYFLQDTTPDDNAATSEGIYVFGGAGVKVGDDVLVTGTVSDYYPDAAPSVAQDLSVTELGGHPISCVLSSGNALPAPEVITPTTVPDLYAPDLGGGNIEATPITPSRSALDFWESREAMRVEVDDARVVGPTDKYGEQYVTTKPTQSPSYRGGTLLTAENATPSGRVELVPLAANKTVSVGDVLRGATVGPVDYSEFGGFTIAATQEGDVDTTGGVTPVVATTPAARQLSVATYNVENLAPSDPASKYSALAAGIVTNLASPDVVALEEVQDNSGATDDGTVSAEDTLTTLTAAITAAGGPAYSWRYVNPVNDQDGGQPGGNIRVAFLFDPKRVSFVDRGAASTDRSTVGTQVVGRFGSPDLTLSPGRIDPTNSAWDNSRKPLVGEFRFQGKPVFVVANHFDSKLGDGNADGRFQYPTRSSEVQRIQQATLVHDFVASLLKKNPLAQTIVLGDLNDYQFSPALSVLRTGRTDGSVSGRSHGGGLPLLTDLISTLPKNQQYTYVYDGISQVLDHILVTPGTYLTGKVDYQVVHINSEFANQTSDHDPQVVRLFGSYR